MADLRFSAVKEASRRRAVETPAPEGKTSDYFGKYVFDRNNMRKYLSKETLKLVLDAIDKGEPLDRQVANHVAAGMRMWAMEMGATHYTHWFHPLTDGTAEKHDAFVDFDGNGGVIEEFSGKLLAQQEPDASSFPSGGIRNTFEARGYTAWDPSSPAFIVKDTLCIPTIFISYTGEALDYKTPLLKSIAAVDKAATEVCHYFDKEVKKVFSFLGWEQEYFLVDEALYNARPDLMLTGRTLMGHESSKNQQLEDHYFGSIPRRVSAFMRDLEYECYKLSIPVKTRHNEVAPNQFEVAPIFEECNLAVDHNLLLMSTMDMVAERHGFKVLLHEKPFKGINGSGKHNNWSLGTDTGINLLGAGKNAKENLQFITFVANVLMAVYKNNALLKASISSATNAHRLGANEAPPAIISVFMGTQISDLLNEMESSKGLKDIELQEKTGKRLSLNYIPEIMVDNTDRNRTSPFAFTGNRFEFRAVGSSANCAAAMLALNTAVAGQLKQFKSETDSLIAQGKTTEEALFTMIQQYIRESKAIRFDGNGYSDEWKTEAEKRGLDCETRVPVIYDAYITPQSIKLFREAGVLSEKEIHARNEVKWEIYTKKIQIEARVLGDLAMNHIIPVATRYQGLLLDNVSKIFALYDREKASKIAAQDLAIIEEIADHLNFIKIKVDEMVEARKQANKIENEREKALAYCETIAPYFDAIRYHIDKLELTVDNEMWTLPKYRELLFIR
ncbi:glutamine synthetase III [Parabacteroides sp. OttesenSCG-928-N08]|nr:glutamine synthetase III [Parabacteroides sp. OttesenSCG-928-N08]